MNIIKQLGIILLFVVIGEFTSYFLRWLIPTFFIPGAVLGMLWMIFAFYIKILKVEAVEDVGCFLTRNMPFFFIPAAVSVMEYFGALEQIFAKLILIVFISTIVTFLATAFTVKFLMNLQKKWMKEEVEAHD